MKQIKRFQLWIKRPSLAFPVCSSESARIRPSAEASGMVRNARRKLLALRGRDRRGWIGKSTWETMCSCNTMWIRNRTSVIQRNNNKYVPDMDLLVTNPTCGRGSRAHRPSKTPSGTNDSALDTGLAPGNIIPNVPTQKQEKNNSAWVTKQQSLFNITKTLPCFLPGSCSCSRRWGCEAPGQQTRFCCNV